MWLTWLGYRLAVQYVQQKSAPVTSFILAFVFGVCSLFFAACSLLALVLLIGYLTGSNG